MGNQKLSARIASHLEEMISSSARVLLAVSGGSDSMAMLHLFSQAVPAHQIVVGFVDHGLRTGIEAEWQLVKDQSEKLGITAKKYVIHDRYDDSVYKNGVQQWAREHRYRLLERGAMESQCSVIATGHTLDDQAETVLLRMLRGTGLDGLSAVPAKRTLDSDVVIIRPLLGISRTELKDWLRNHNILWASDPSNGDERFTRVRVRKVLPELVDINPQIKNHLCDLSREAAAVIAWIEKSLIDKNEIKTLKYAGGFKVNHEFFEKVPRDLWGRVVRHVLRRCKGNLRRLERAHIDAIISGLRKTDGVRCFEIPGSLDVRVAYGDLYVFPNKLPAENVIGEQKLVLGSSNYTCGANGAVKISVRMTEAEGEMFKKTGSLVLRTSLQGDKLYGRKQLVSKVFAENRVPLFYRSLIPVLANDKNEVISIPRLLKSQVSGLRIEWTLGENCELRDLKRFG